MNTERAQTLNQMFSLLCAHAGIPPELPRRARREFVRDLIEYPDDLLCASYTYVRKRLPPRHLPTSAAMVGFMAPEISRRQRIACEVVA